MSDKPKWTPGPWRSWNDEDVKPVTVSGPNGVVLARLSLSKEVDHSKAIANARLIASAPALAEVLDSAPDFGGEPTTAFGREYREWQQKALAALAAAKGESQ